MPVFWETRRLSQNSNKYGHCEERSDVAISLHFRKSVECNEIATLPKWVARDDMLLLSLWDNLRDSRNARFPFPTPKN